MSEPFDEIRARADEIEEASAHLKSAASILGARVGEPTSEDIADLVREALTLRSLIEDQREAVTEASRSGGLNNSERRRMHRHRDLLDDVEDQVERTDEGLREMSGGHGLDDFERVVE